MRALALTLAATAALVSACGGSPGETKTLPPAPTSPAAQSPSAVPTGKDAPTPEGAAEFARFFYAQITAAFETKNPDLLTAISLPTCETCARYIQSITQLRDKNERATGTTFDIKLAEAPAISGSDVSVSIVYDAPEAVRYSATGKVTRREPALKGAQEQVVLRRRGNSWVIVEVR